MRKNKENNYALISKYREELFGFFTILVLFFHSPKIHFSQLTVLPESMTRLLDNIRKSGNIGVDAFLILSGIGLYYSLSKDSNTVNFYKRRCRVLFPTVFIGAALWFGTRSLTLEDYFIHIFLGGVFISGESYYWYFSLLCILYLVYPIIRKYENNLKNADLYFISIISVCVLATILFSRNSYFNKIEILITRIPSFLIGCWLAEKVYHKMRIKLPVIIAGFVLVVPLFYIYCSRVPKIVYRYTGTLLALSLILSLVFIFSIASENMVLKLLRKIGKYSLEYYVLYSAICYFCLPWFNIKGGTGIGNYIPVFVLTSILAVALKSVHKLFWDQF